MTRGRDNSHLIDERITERIMQDLERIQGVMLPAMPMRVEAHLGDLARASANAAARIIANMVQARAAKHGGVVNGDDMVKEILDAFGIESDNEAS